MAEPLNASIVIKVLDAFTAPLRNLKTGLEDVGDVGEKVRRQIDFAADLNQAAEGMGRFSDMMLDPLKGSLDEFKAFEYQMSRVQALTNNLTDESFARLKQASLELGASTAFSSEEVAATVAAYGQAGREADDILKILPMTLSASVATGTDLATTAKLIGATMRSLGMDTDETARAVDVMTAASNASDMELTDLGHALAYVGPIARDAKMDIELTAAMIAKLKDAGIDASSAGTGLRATIARLVNPSKAARKAFAEMGLSAGTLAKMQKAIAAGNLDEALASIGEATEKLPDEKRLRLLNEVFGEQASTAAAVLIKTSMDTDTTGLSALEAALRKANGTTEKMAKTMGDNLVGAEERASGAISGLKTQLGEVLAPTARDVYDTVGAAADAMSKFAGENPNVTRATLELMGHLGALAAVMKGGLLAVSAYTAATAFLTKTYAGLSASWLGKAGLVAAALAAGYAVGTWANEMFGLSDKLLGLFGSKAPDAVDKGTEVYAGGTEIDAYSGEVKKLGTGPGPKVVQRARAAGATSLDDINAFIRKEREEKGRNAALSELGLGEGAPATAPAPPAGTRGPDAGDPATREQTRLQERRAREQEKLLRDIRDDNRRKRPPLPGAPSPVGVF